MIAFIILFEIHVWVNQPPTPLHKKLNKLKTKQKNYVVSIIWYKGRCSMSCKLYHTVGTFVQAGLAATRLFLHECTNCVIQFTRQCSWWWTCSSSETCRASKNSEIKIICKNLCILLVRLHNPIRCTVHTTLNWRCSIRVFVVIEKYEGFC